MQSHPPRRPRPLRRYAPLTGGVVFVLSLAAAMAWSVVGERVAQPAPTASASVRAHPPAAATRPATQTATGLTPEQEQEFERLYLAAQRQVRELVRKRFLRIDGADYRMKPAYWSAMSAEQKRDLVTACYILNGAAATRVLADRGDAVLGQWPAGEEKPEVYE